MPTGFHRFLYFAMGLMVFAATSLSAIGQADPNLDDLNQKFESYLEQLDRDHTTKTKAWASAYQSTLQRLQRHIQASGKLDKLIAVREEIDRFAADRNLPPAAIVTSPPELNAVQAEYATRLRQETIEDNRSVLALARKFDAHLISYQKHLTTNGRIEEALAVKANRDATADNPRVTAAEFELALLEAADDADSNTGDTGDLESVPEPEPEPDTPPPSDVVVSHGVTVYDDGQRPRSAPGMDYRRLNLDRTAHTPLGSGLIIDSSAAVSSTTTKHSAYDNSQSSRWALRLGMRSTPAKGTIPDVLVVVQFYVNQPGQGRVEPILRDTRRINLPEVSPSTITVDFDEVKTESRQMRVGAHRWRHLGHDFYGAIVSIFDVNRSLLYQGVTAGGLKDLAQAAVPEQTVTEQLGSLSATRAERQATMETAWELFQADPQNQRLQQDYMRARQQLDAINMKIHLLRSGPQNIGR
ncbi:MAG: hypothetical protein O3A51_03340 [Verrucomicrobia bacterium]|nr:hypothetical protein [Verrucomicrobiota bacterium]